MNSVKLDNGATVTFHEEWYGAPWTAPETIVLLHGIGETSRAWVQWVPVLSRHFRVLRPDLPGYGGSSPPEGDDYLPAQLADAVRRFLDAMQVGKAHIAGAKYGATIALQFATNWPERTLSLSLMGLPINGGKLGGGVDFAAAPERIRTAGTRQWAAETQRARLGDVPQAQLDWWSDALMGSVPDKTCHDSIVSLLKMNIEPRLGLVSVPTLLVGSAGSTVQPSGVLKAAQKRIPNSRYVEISANSYHVAASHPELCAQEVIKFIAELPPQVSAPG